MTKAFCRNSSNNLYKLTILFGLFSGLSVGVAFQSTTGTVSVSSRSHKGQIIIDQRKNNNNLRIRDVSRRQRLYHYSTYQSLYNGEHKEEKNLYEILGTHQLATPKELKQAYFRLAKRTHPDAIRQQGEVPGSSSNVEFGDVVAAYKLLSDPKERKRYDRELNAKQFTRDVQHLATNLADTAAEMADTKFSKWIETFGAPFLRRTTTTTMAAAAKFANNTVTTKDEKRAKSGRRWQDAFKDAVTAARRTGRLLDGIELLEKYDELKYRARKRVNEAYQVKEKLDALKRKRMSMMLYDPNAPLSATDASALLIHWGLIDENNNLSFSAVEHDMHWGVTPEESLRSLAQDIDELQQHEQSLSQAKANTLDNQKKLSMVQRTYDQAKMEVNAAIQAEYVAQQTLLKAQEQVRIAKQKLLEATDVYSPMEAKAKATAMEEHSVTSTVSEKRERIRGALRKQLETMIQTDQLPNGDWFQTDVSYRQVEDLRKEEETLNQEYQSAAEQAARLLSRAHKLKERVEALEEMNKRSQ